MGRDPPTVGSMSSNGTRRPPPAFQMYSSDRLADRQFKMMTLAERGLLHTLELEMWVNRSVPVDVSAMARILGLDAGEVAEALSERVLARFTQSGDDLSSPDLEAYRQKLEEHHRKKSEGGKKGMANRWGDRSADSSPDNSVTNSLNNSLSREEKKGEESKPVSLEHAEFLSEFCDGEPDFLRGPAARTKPGIRE